MPKTYNDLYITARRALRDAGIEAYSLEARLIIAHASGKTMEKLLQNMQFYTSAEVEAEVSRLTERRLRGEPVAYLTNAWEFYGLPMEVTPDVLIPRTDTETLVDVALSLLRGRKMDARILDLCCGSGCIGCAMALNLPASRVVMLDISDKALRVARRNVNQLGLGSRVLCTDADARKTPPMLVGSFDALLCNPPYIPSGDILMLDPSVRDYEPVWALDGGEDGLDFYRDILKYWKSVLRPGGILLFEVGIGQSAAVQKLMRNAGFLDVCVHPDSRGIERVISGHI
ncbi:MAG: peptide chain release factor N(5)-glutamine methyltransferase [Oscillospiraceae bacterium]|nr:peptide chain release factor N(5)-glutamine methyltransferase [Oscillospiraceae bacterium]